LGKLKWYASMMTAIRDRSVYVGLNRCRFRRTDEHVTRGRKLEPGFFRVEKFYGSATYVDRISRCSQRDRQQVMVHLTPKERWPKENTGSQQDQKTVLHAFSVPSTTVDSGHLSSSSFAFENEQVGKEIEEEVNLRFDQTGLVWVRRRLGVS
jgi:hypothetical protein